MTDVEVFFDVVRILVRTGVIPKSAGGMILLNSQGSYYDERKNKRV